jgi:hypothetical protein
MTLAVNIGVCLLVCIYTLLAFFWNSMHAQWFRISIALAGAELFLHFAMYPNDRPCYSCTVPGVYMKFNQYKKSMAMSL